MKPTAPYIRWNQANLERHHRKRVEKDAGCFEELMGINPPPMSVEQYRQRSLDTVAGSWAEYEAEGWDVEKRKYSEARAYYVDNDLVCSITDVPRSEFVTCFHAAHDEGKHFHPKFHDADKTAEGIGNRRLRFMQKLQHQIQGKLIRQFKAKRGVPNV